MHILNVFHKNLHIFHGECLFLGLETTRGPSQKGLSQRRTCCRVSSKANPIVKGYTGPLTEGHQVLSQKQYVLLVRYHFRGMLVPWVRKYKGPLAEGLEPKKNMLPGFQQS